MMKIHIAIPLILLAFTVVIVSDSGEGCLPVKALFICTGNDLEHSSRQQRRFVLRLIDELPYRSHIALKVAGNNEEIYEFEKNASYTYYRQEIVNLYFNLSTNNTASYKEVSDAMFQFLDQNEIPKMAEVIYFIVNENTKLDDIQYVYEALKNKKRFIVLHGEHLEGDIWTSLAQDEEHIQVLGDSEENVTLAVKSVKTQSCKDSRYVCDTNQYWTDKFSKRCYWCWRICDMIPSQRSDSCNKSCPYYSEGQSNMLKVDDTCSCNYDTIIIVTVFIMAVVTVFIGLVAWWQIRNKNRKDKVADDSVLDSIDTNDGVGQVTEDSSFISVDRRPNLPQPAPLFP